MHCIFWQLLLFGRGCFFYFYSSFYPTICHNKNLCSAKKHYILNIFLGDLYSFLEIEIGRFVMLRVFALQKLGSECHL